MEKKGSNYEAIMARSFSRQERSKMGWWACLAFFLLAFAFCFFFKPPPPPYTTTNLASYPVSAPVEVGKTDFLNVQATKHFEINIPPQPYSSKAEDARPICKTHPRSDIFHAKGDIRVLSTSNSSSLSPTTIDVVSNVSMSWNIKPYARKLDPFAMRNVRNITINQVSLSSHHHQLRNCTRKYNIPAVVFSLAGYTGNLFHDLSDVILPLFLTTHEFHREVHFLVVDYRQWWVNKYKNVLQGLTKYDIINLDNIGKDDVICFPRITVGLKANKEFTIDDDIVSGDVLPLSMKNFTKFLRSVYHLKRDVTIKTKKPRLLIISRSKTRRFLNIDEIATMALGLGFEVVAQETGVDMNRVSRFVNKFDAVVGVHGAGLSNMVFLPENAVVVQVVGLGMDGIAKTDYELPSLDMGLRYLEYKIGLNESSLIDKYPMGHDVFTNRSAISSKGWDAFREVYLDNQDVKLDVDRFRGTLLKVQELLHT